MLRELRVRLKRAIARAEDGDMVSLAVSVYHAMCFRLLPSAMAQRTVWKGVRACEELARVGPPVGGGGGIGRLRRAARTGIGFRTWSARWKMRPSKARRPMKRMLLSMGDGV